MLSKLDSNSEKLKWKTYIDFRSGRRDKTTESSVEVVIRESNYVIWRLVKDKDENGGVK